MILPQLLANLIIFAATSQAFFWKKEIAPVKYTSIENSYVTQDSFIVEGLSCQQIDCSTQRPTKAQIENIRNERFSEDDIICLIFHDTNGNILPQSHAMRFYSVNKKASDVDRLFPYGKSAVASPNTLILDIYERVSPWGNNALSGENAPDMYSPYVDAYSIGRPIFIPVPIRKTGFFRKQLHKVKRFVRKWTGIGRTLTSPSTSLEINKDAIELTAKIPEPDQVIQWAVRQLGLDWKDRVIDKKADIVINALGYTYGAEKYKKVLDQCSIKKADPYDVSKFQSNEGAHLEVL